jgi:hypothetical protein
MASAESPFARRASGLSITPFAAIVLAFFLPTIRACDGVRRPATYVLQYPHAAPTLVPPYLSALVFAIFPATWLVTNSQPSRRGERVATVALALSALSSTASLLGFAIVPSTTNGGVLAWCTAMVCVALLGFQRARRVSGWSRWARFVLVQGCLNAANIVFIMIAFAAFDGAWDAIYAGGYCYALGTIAVCIVGLSGLKRGDPSVQPQDPPSS